MRRLFKCVLGAIAVLGGAPSTAGLAQAGTLPYVSNAQVQFWFAPMTWTIDQSTLSLIYTYHDFPSVIAPNSTWPKGQSEIATITLPANIVWSYPNRPDLVAFANRNPNIKINMGFGVMFNGGQCGVGIEGESADTDYNHEAVIIAQELKAAGGRLDYITMDDPLLFGHTDTSGCLYSIQEVANRTAATLNLILAQFPNAEVVNAAGPAFESNAAWFADQTQFHAALKALIGKPVYAISLDLHWTDLRPSETIQDTIQKSVAYFHNIGVRVGLFIDADGTAADMASDEAWMTQYRPHLAMIARGEYGLDYIAIESWINLPQYNLPETDVMAFSSLISYAQRVFKP